MNVFSLAHLESLAQPVPVMNRIESQVASARRRLMLGTFGRALCYTMFAALLVATIAIAIPAIWVMNVDSTTWAYGWIGGCIVAGLIAAGAYACLLYTSPSPRDGLLSRMPSSA